MRSLSVCHMTHVSSSQVSTAQEIIRHFEGQPADLVVCDGAPDGETYFLFLRFSLHPLALTLLSRLHSNRAPRRGRVHPGSAPAGREYAEVFYVLGSASRATWSLSHPVCLSGSEHHDSRPETWRDLCGQGESKCSVHVIY